MHKRSSKILQNTIGIFGGDMRGNHMFDYRLCLGVLLEIQSQISTPAYIYSKENNKEEFEKQLRGNYPPLDRTMGICGHHVLAFQTLLSELGYKTRDVQIYFQLPGTIEINSHVVVEVFFGEKWRMFDITWGWHPYVGETENVIGFSDLANDNYKIAMNDIDPWTNTARRNKPDEFLYFTRNQEFGILYNLAGILQLPEITTPKSNSKLNISLTGVPKFIGSGGGFNGNDWTSQLEWVLKFKDNQKRKIEISLKDITWPEDIGKEDKKELSMLANDVMIPVNLKKITIPTADSSVHLKFKSTSQYVPYAIIDKIIVEKA